MPIKKQNNFRLKEFKPDSGFQVPNGYFVAFPEHLLDRIHSVKETPYKKSTFFSFKIHQLALAASFIGIMILAYSGIKFAINKQAIKAGIQKIEIAEFPDNTIYDIDETMIYDLYSETSTDNNTINSAEINDTDEMINYLILEDSEIEVLIQEL